MISIACNNTTHEPSCHAHPALVSRAVHRWGSFRPHIGLFILESFRVRMDSRLWVIILRGESSQVPEPARLASLLYDSTLRPRTCCYRSSGPLCQPAGNALGILMTIQCLRQFSVTKNDHRGHPTHLHPPRWVIPVATRRTLPPTISGNHRPLRNISLREPKNSTTLIQATVTTRPTLIKANALMTFATLLILTPNTINPKYLNVENFPPPGTD